MSSSAGRRAHYLQHVSFEGLGSIGPWLQSAGYRVTGTRYFAGESPPPASEIDLLVVMGGPMSANDDDALPWLRREKRLIREVIEAGAPVLGVCLGAQLIAAALGARVRPAPVREIGWFPIEATPEAAGSPFPLPAVHEAFHWHSDTFELPPGAVHLARSEACEHQAFHAGATVLGLQCHLEVTPQIVENLVRQSGHQLEPSRSVQPRETLLGAAPEQYGSVNVLMARLLSELTGIRSAAGPAGPA